MVGKLQASLRLLQGSLLAQTLETSHKLPPPTRAAAMMTLLGILILGMLLVVIILVGGHWIRRWGSYRRGPAVPPDLVLSPMPENPRRVDLPKSANTNLNEGDTMIPDDTRC